MKSLLAGVIAMTLTATTASAFAGETPAPPADTAAAAPAAAAPPPAAAAAPVAATPLALHVAAPSPKPLALAPTSDGMGAFTKILLVLGIGAGLAFYLKKKKGAARAGAPAPTKIAILARAGLGVRSQLVVIEVEGTRLLVGMTPSAIQTLAVLDTPEDVVGAPAADHEPTAALTLARDADEELFRPANLGDRFRSLLGTDEPVMPRISPIKPAAGAKPRAVRGGSRTAPARTKSELTSREVAGQARGLLLSVDEDK